MPSIPLVRGAAQAIYPCTKQLIFDTGIAWRSDATEQRWKRRAPLFRFELPYSSLPVADRDAIVAIFAGQKGAFDNDTSFTLGATTFDNLAFEEDEIQCSEPRRGLYELKLALRQVKNRAYAIPGAAATFPTITDSVYTQLPYEPRFRNLTSFTDSPSGYRYSYAWWAGGLTGLPTAQLHGWKYSYPSLSDADLATLETFFTAMQGRLTMFTVTDPESAVSYPKCRFDQDTLSIQYAGPNRNSLSLAIVEFN